MLARAPLERHAVLGEVEPLGGVATVEKVAANAVMAGCEPAYFPVVLAAVQALLDPAFNLRGVQTTDENVAPLLVVNGPAAGRLGINAGWGALGPGWPANAAIGRAVRLVMNNLGGGWPGAVLVRGPGPAGPLRSAWPSGRTRRGRRSTSSWATGPSRARSRSCARRR